MRHVTPFFFQGIRSTNVDVQRRPIFDFDFRGTLRAKSLSLKRINTFEWLLKIETNVRGCRIILKTFYQHSAMKRLAPNILIKGNLILIIFTQNIKDFESLKRIFIQLFRQNTFERIVIFYILGKNDQNSIFFYQDVCCEPLHSWVLVECV